MKEITTYSIDELLDDIEVLERENTKLLKCVSEYEEMLKHMRPIVHAYWRIECHENPMLDFGICSNCGARQSNIHLPYCPYCGATMNLDQPKADNKS